MFAKMVGCFALLLAGSFSAVHASDTYKVDLGVTRKGQLIAKPSVEVLADQEAELVMTPEGGPDSAAVRILMSVVPAGEQGTVGIHLKIFDRSRDAWNLRAEPALKLRLRKDASLTVADAGIQVSVSVAPSA